MLFYSFVFFFFSSRRRHTRLQGDWSSDVCSSDLRESYGKRFQIQIWITKWCAGKPAWGASGNNDLWLLPIGKEATSRERRKPCCPRHAFGWMVASEIASPTIRRLSSSPCDRTIHFRKLWERGGFAASHRNQIPLKLPTCRKSATRKRFSMQWALKPRMYTWEANAKSPTF